MGGRTRAAETLDPAEERDADSLSGEPVRASQPPRRREPTGGTAALGREAQEAIRWERLEARLESLETGQHEMRDDVRAVIAALEGRTRVSERCIRWAERLSLGLVEIVKARPHLALVALVLAVLVIAPGPLLMLAESPAGMRVADAIVRVIPGGSARATALAEPAP